MGLIKNLLTKNKTEIPLFFVMFNYKKYKESGKVGSCIAQIHPILNGDDEIKAKINDLIDHIRDKYDMEKM